MWIASMLLLTVVVAQQARSEQQPVSQVLEDDRKLRDLNRCGAHGLALIGAFTNSDFIVSEVDALLPENGLEIDMQSIRKAAYSLGLRSHAIRWNRVPQFLPSPAIVRTIRVNGSRHFVVLLARRDDEVLIGDVPHSPYWIKISDFDEHYDWNHVALHFVAANQSIFLFWIGVIWLKLRISFLVLFAVVVTLAFCLKRLRPGPLENSRLGRACLTIAMITLATFAGCNDGDQKASLEIIPGSLSRSIDDPATTANGMCFSTLILRNNSATVARIKAVKSGCGCVSAKVSSTVVPPNDQIELCLAMEVPEYGNRRTAVVLKTDHANQKVIRLPVVLRGKEIPVPHFYRFPKHSIRLLDQIESKIEIATIERAGSNPWLNSLESGSGTVLVNLNDVKTRPYSTPGLVIRDYCFVAATAGLQYLGYEALHFKTSRSCSMPTPSITVELRKTRKLRACPASIVFAVGPETRFPLFRNIEVVLPDSEFDIVENNGSAGLVWLSWDVSSEITIGSGPCKEVELTIAVQNEPKELSRNAFLNSALVIRSGGEVVRIPVIIAKDQ